MRSAQLLGQYGEEIAVRHLRQAGIAVLERNWRGPSGEIDIVARDGGELVICEVKTRSGQYFGPPTAAVTPAKIERLRALATEWLAARALSVTAVRFDVVSVVRSADGQLSVEHLRAVV